MSAGDWLTFSIVVGACIAYGFAIRWGAQYRGLDEE